jgi:hypothetical protein
VSLDKLLYVYIKNNDNKIIYKRIHVNVQISQTVKSIFRFLNDPNKSVDLRRWGTEGLAYLTLDAEVKEELINDTAALRSLIDVVAVSVSMSHTPEIIFI